MRGRVPALVELALVLLVGGDVAGVGVAVRGEDHLLDAAVLQLAEQCGAQPPGGHCGDLARDGGDVRVVLVERRAR